MGFLLSFHFLSLCFLWMILFSPFFLSFSVVFFLPFSFLHLEIIFNTRRLEIFFLLFSLYLLFSFSLFSLLFSFFFLLLPPLWKSGNKTQKSWQSWKSDFHFPLFLIFMYAFTFSLIYWSFLCVLFSLYGRHELFHAELTA